MDTDVVRASNQTVFEMYHAHLHHARQEENATAKSAVSVSSPIVVKVERGFWGDIPIARTVTIVIDEFEITFYRNGANRILKLSAFHLNGSRTFNGFVPDEIYKKALKRVYGIFFEKGKNFRNIEALQ